MGEIRIKQGDALRLLATVQDDDGQPVDLTVATLRGAVRTATGDLVTSLPIVRAEAAGVALITVADTTQWPVGLLRADILLTSDGLPIHSDTFGIHVGRAVTR